MRSQWIFILTVVFTVFVLTVHTALARADGNDALKSVSPETAGFDPEAIEKLIDDLRSNRLLRDLHSFLVVRGGDLVVEEYFDRWGPEDLHTLQSVSKSVTSALVGIAIERGDLSGVDENVLSFFPDYGDIKNLDDRKRAIQLEDLLTMRSGVDYDEGYVGSPHSRLNRLDSGWDRFYLDRPMKFDPGTRFQYDSGAVILTSSLIERRTGMHADAYAVKYLFKPLGIQSYRWSSNDEGHPHTGGGLYLSARDMAKFGLLFLRKGRWGGMQVVPENWVETSTSQHVDFDRQRWDGHGTGYGYWWWILGPDPAGPGEAAIFAAIGFRGQHILVAPEHDLVVVTTAGIDGAEMHKPVDILYTHVLPAIVREERVRGSRPDRAAVSHGLEWPTNIDYPDTLE